MALAELNPTAQQSLNNLKIDFSINPMVDTEAASLGMNLAKFKNLESGYFNIKDMALCKNLFHCTPSLTGFGVASLVDGISKLEKLKTLALFSRDLKQSDQGYLKRIAQSIDKMPTLKSLTLQFSDNKLHDTGAKILLKSISSIQSLTSVNVNLAADDVGDAAFLSAMSLAQDLPTGL